MSMKSSWSLWQRIKKRFDTSDGYTVLKGTTTTGTIVTDVITGVPKIVVASSSGTANTFGAWAAYDASTSAISSIAGITIGMPATGSTQDVQVDIGVTESAVISIPFNYYIKSDVGYLPTVVVMFPIPINVAASAAISVRVSDSQAVVNAYRIGLVYYQGI